MNGNQKDQKTTFQTNNEYFKNKIDRYFSISNTGTYTIAL